MPLKIYMKSQFNSSSNLVTTFCNREIKLFNSQESPLSIESMYDIRMINLSSPQEDTARTEPDIHRQPLNLPAGTIHTFYNLRRFIQMYFVSLGDLSQYSRKTIRNNKDSNVTMIVNSYCLVKVRL